MLIVDEIIASAKAKTGLAEIGDERILEGLNVLVDALNGEAALSERGQVSFQTILVNTLANRMRVEDWLKRHPALLERPIERPMFVFGLPRTGTTLAINLLAEDPARRCLLRWEAFDSVPPPQPKELHAGPRYDAAKAALDLSIKYAPQIAAIHHEYADSPTECQFAMSPSFCAQYYESIAAIPSYRAWFLGADYRPAFEYHKRLLQLLQANAPGRWTLKNPWHPLFLDALTEIYPDAQLVMTHRDPVAVVGSACSLIKHVRVMFSDTVDLAAIGADMVDTFETMIARMLAYREQHGWDSICDVSYKALTRDPVGEMQRVYAHFGETLSSAAEAAMRAYVDRNPQGKHGRHDYGLEEYGLSEGEVRERFANYERKFLAS